MRDLEVNYFMIFRMVNDIVKERVMKGRVLSILFAVVLSAGLIAGCSSKGSVDMPTEGDEDINIDNQVDGDGETGLTIYDIQNPDSPNHPQPNTSVTLRGVIATTGLFKVSDNLNGFFASDPEGGAWHGILVTVFKDTEIENFELGAKLIVSGTYKEFYEMSEIDADSVMVTGTGTVPDPVVIDDPCSIGTNGADAEMYESVLVELHDVTVTEGANQYGEFKVGDGACLIVDDKVFSYEAPAVGTTYSVLRGVMYYNFNEFKLNPRSADDMVVSGTDGDIEIDGEGSGGLTIYDIQNPDSPNHPAENSAVQLSGVVVMSEVFQASRNLKGIFVSDPEGGAWRGIEVVFGSDITDEFHIGDVVDIAGTYKEYYEFSEISATSITKTGTTTPPEPVFISDPCTIATGGADAESYEGVLVEVHNVTVTDEADDHDQFKVANCLMVDDKIFDYENPAVGTVFGILRGFLMYSFDDYKLAPRDANDMQEGEIDGDIDEEQQTDGDVEEGSEQPSGLTVYDIQNESSPNHPAVETEVSLSGVVVMSEVFQAARSLKGFFVSDPEGGAWHGIEIVFDDVLTMSLNIGDVVDITGTYKEYYNFSEIEATSITINGTTTPPDPVVISDPCNIATGGTDAESYEGVLVEVHDVTVTDEADEHDQFKVANCLMVDDKIFDYENPAVGTTYSVLRGFLLYSFDDYKLAPRDENDMVVSSVPDGDEDVVSEDETEISESAETDGDVETSEDTETTETSENTETAQPADHLLITEISVTPTDGEFVEIYNPTDQSVDLSNYYLYNSTYGPNGVYFYNIPTGEGYGADSNSDFVVKFPDGASIAPGQYITIAVASASAFNTTYGMNPDYELPKTDGNDPNVPDMVKLTMASNAGLTNSSEDLVLLYWDGQSDLVSVVDYLIWGTKTNVRTDLTGVCIDGPDLDTEQSCYLDGAAVDNQTPATANNSSNTMQRVDMSEGAEVKANGNGITGHVEASEDLNNTWTTATATPGAAYTGN